MLNADIESFDKGELWIDIAHLNMSKDNIVEELGDVLEQNSSAIPWTRETWPDYIRHKAEEDSWKYVKVKTYLERASGVATREHPDGHDVISARDFVSGLTNSVRNEDFDSLFD